MKVAKEAVVQLFRELGFKVVEKWNDKRLAEKLEKLPTIVDETTKAESEDGQALLKKILQAVKEGDTVKIVSNGEAPKAEKAEVKEEKPAKKKVKEEEKAEEDEDEDEDSEDEDEDSEDEDEEEEEEEAPKAKAKSKKKVKVKEEEDEDEDEEEEEKPKKKGGNIGNFKKAGGPNGPGVIASIEEFLKETSADKPITKKGILKKLCKRFPDRDADSMSKTIAVQVPNRMNKDKSMGILKHEDGGYYLGKGSKKAKDDDEDEEKPTKKKSKKVVEEDDDEDE